MFRRAATSVLLQPFRSSILLRAPTDVPEALRADIAKVIQHDRVVLFLTGTPQEPRCRFTSATVDLIHQLDIEYSFFNILEDDEVCEGLKIYSDWPTYPQIYVDQELIGGYDVLKKLMLSGDLTKMLKEKGLLAPSGDVKESNTSKTDE